MLLRESDLDTSLRVFDLLDQMPVLDEASATVVPAMVPIHHIPRLDKNLIQLEDFCRFGESNGIDDGTEAINLVCEASSIPADTDIAFCVNEASLYESDELAKTANSLRENGYQLFIQEISSQNPYYKQLQEAIELDKQYTTLEESVHLMAFCEEGLADRVKGNINYMQGSANNLSDSVKDKYNKVKDAITSVPDKAKERINQVKDAVGGATKAIAQKYAAVKKALREKIDAAKKLPGQAKNAAQKQINKLKALASQLKAKLQQAKQKVTG